MGRVYRAEPLDGGQPVAVKILHPHLGCDPASARRFHREARAASLFSHPHAIHVDDFGATGDGTLFLVMELLEGEDLQTVLDHDAPLAPARIVTVMVQTLRAVDHAHRAGIVHRDLKPENVIVTTDADGLEHVKVCDFGIARVMDLDGGTTAITKDGYVCGTPEYMAPEQARGATIDGRTDVYAAGVMLYQMLTGQVPFAAPTPLGVITKHVREPPVPPRSARPDWNMPPTLEAIALRALAKRPDDRFASAGEMADALERAEAARPLDPRPAPRPLPSHGTWGPLWTLALLGSIGVFGLGVWLWCS